MKGGGKMSTNSAIGASVLLCATIICLGCCGTSTGEVTRYSDLNSKDGGLPSPTPDSHSVGMTDETPRRGISSYEERMRFVLIEKEG